VGKTAIAVEVCLRVGGEIISVDSRQVYRGLEVASNAPTPAELRGVPCHLVGVVEPSDRMDAARYVRLARPVVERLAVAGTPVIFTAGTGLYLRALLEGFDLGGVAPDPALRAELETAAAADLPLSVDRLRTLDPEGARGIDLQNPVRVVRRLEIALLRGRKDAAAGRQAEPIGATWVGLRAAPELLRLRIEERTDRMLAAGLLPEVERLVRQGLNPRGQAFRGIGVAEIASHLRGERWLADAREAIVRSTLAYAKRQMTWFRAEPDVRWFDVSVTPTSDIVEAICRLIRT
jgi:tRNA dimethylallyltransferase